MSIFTFSAIVGTAVVAEYRPMQSKTIDHAKREGRLILARLALEHVPTGEEMISIELFNGTGEPLAELRLCYQELEKQPGAAERVD